MRKKKHTPIVDRSLATAVMCDCTEKISIIRQRQCSEQARDFRGQLHAKESRIERANMRGLASKQVVDEEVGYLEDAKRSEPAERERFKKGGNAV